jgi:hypothetical protein
MMVSLVGLQEPTRILDGSEPLNMFVGYSRNKAMLGEGLRLGHALGVSGMH